MTPPDLPTLRAQRDRAFGRVDSYVRNDPCFRYGSGHVCFRDDLDALLKLEGDVRVVEACEALETASPRTLRDSLAFLRARLTANDVSGSSTPEETGR